MRVWRRTGFGGGGHESCRPRPWIRLALALATALIFSASFGEVALAQCPGGPPVNIGPFAPCVPSTPTLNPSAANAHLSAEAGVLDLATQYLQRLNALGTFKTGASGAANPQGGGAEPDAERFRTWFEGYALRATTDAQGTFTGDSRKTYGGVAGFGATLAPGVNVGLSVDQGQTMIDIAGVQQTGRIDLTQIGGLATFEHGPWNLGLTGVHGFGNVKSNRFDGVGTSIAAYHAQLWAAMAELSYYHALPENSRLVPKLTFDWMHTHTDAFSEIGGTGPATGSAVEATRVRMMIGAELGHSWLVDRRIVDFLVYGRFVDNLQQNFGSLQVTFASGAGAPVLVSGVRESQYGADAGATLSTKVTDSMRLYLVYDGRYRSNLVSHGGTAGAEFRF